MNSSAGQTGAPSFLGGGGDLGARMRVHDWSGSPLGNPSTWPQSLRSVVGLLLNSRFPMFLAWGDELGFLYNDAYAEILGAKHPAALGRRFRDIWGEIWSEISPLIDAAMAGEATYRENLPLLVNRQGFAEQAWFTFSYSPVRDESGAVAGMFCAVSETSVQVRSEKRRDALLRLDDRLRDLSNTADLSFAASELLGEALGASRVGYGTFDPASGTLSIERDWTAPGFDSVAGVHRFSDYGAYVDSLRHGDPVANTDVEADPRTADKVEAMRSIRVRAFLDVPVVEQGQTVAQLFVHSATPRVWTEEEIAFVRDFAERTRSAIARRIAERELRESEARLRLVQAAGGIGSFDYDLQKDDAICSPEYYALFGLPDGHPINRETWPAAIHPDDRYKATEALDRAIAERRPFDYEYRIIRANDGEVRWLSGRAAIIFDEQDHPWRYVGGNIDITERRRAEDRLRELNETLESQVAERTAERDRTWRLSQDLLVVAEADGTLAAVNGAWTAALGWEESELVGSTFMEFTHPDDVEPTLAVFATIFETPLIDPYEYRLRHKNGGYRWFSWTAAYEDGRVFANGRDVTAEKRRAAELQAAEAARRQADALYRAYFENTAEALFVVGVLPDGGFTVEDLNLAHQSGIGFRLEEVGGKRIDEILPPETAAKVTSHYRAVLASGQVYQYQESFDLRGETRHWDTVLVPVRDGRGRITRVIGSSRDLTRQIVAEEALRQSQKMEAVGQLTGGLAHDFNNLLAGISGSLELMGTRIAQGRMADVDRYLVAAQGATKRAAALTHRLLAFSRRQTLDPKPTDVNRLVSGMEELVRRTVGPQIGIEAVAKAGLWSVLVDPHQLENALLNLCINARDAMPDGGRITIETGNRWLDERAGRERDLPAGQYVSLCVSDNGTGMGPDVIARAFDPFFTTKPIGLGTGLGLSMIYGFVRQSGGQVRIYSEVGQGTMVCLYLPRHYAGEIEAEVPAAASDVGQAEAGETVLVIDDEPIVRMLVVDVLEELGYTALEAGDGPEGLKILRSDARIDLLITDVGLPNGMNGRQVADAARELRPGLKVLFVTGYAENAVLSHGHLDPGMQVVTKPFDMAVLASRIKAMISE